MPKTLYDKLWESHLVAHREDGAALIYIDRHLLHEVTSPQAFSGLKEAGLQPWRVSPNIATPDHNVPTVKRELGIQGIEDEISRIQVKTLDDNCRKFAIPEFTLEDIRQGIVHIVGPEQGATLPGMTVVCGDSHTSTHGAFAALAQGIGTSEVEHVLATQCLLQKKAKNMAVQVDGSLNTGVFSKDLILAIIRQIGTDGGTGHVIEYRGEAIRNLSMEARMTVCNMAIESGARAGMMAFDQTTFDYLQGRPYAPKKEEWESALDVWQDLASDDGSVFDAQCSIDAGDIRPQISWGTSPEMVVDVEERIPDPKQSGSSADLHTRALDYMGLEPGQPITSVYLDRVFIGSCTNARIEDLRIAAKVVKGRKKAKNIRQAMVVPGSGLVKQQAEEEGLHSIFLDAGFEWRAPGCSMCLAMNADKLGNRERCASTSNRNFEGRQGYGGRTHLVSPAMAAMAAVVGHFADVRELLQ